MATRNNIGKTIYFSATLPATNDAAGFEALTWLELEFPQTLPQFGTSHNNIDVPDLKSGYTKGVKGAASGVDSTGTCRIDSSALATNQLTFRSICLSAGGDVAMKVGTGTGTDNALVAGDRVVYAQGYAHSYQENEPSDSTFEGFTYSFKQNDIEVEATEPV